MNNFNKVFQSIKGHCKKQKSFAEISCFDKIAAEAAVPLDKLPDYLDHLQRMGLIRYSAIERYIYLTAFGNQQEVVA